jgi:hypothetical protein
VLGAEVGEGGDVCLLGVGVSLVGIENGEGNRRDGRACWEGRTGGGTHLAGFGKRLGVKVVCSKDGFIVDVVF